MLQEEFAKFVQEKCTDLLNNLAVALDVALVVTNSAGDDILCTPLMSTDSPQSDSGSWVAFPVDTEEETVGYLKADSFAKKDEKILESFASEIGIHFTLELDIDRMTNDLMHAYDQVNLLCTYARVLRPDDDLAVNTGRLVKETAELVGRRLLVQYFPKLASTRWCTGSSQNVTDSLAWLVTDQTAYESVFTAVVERYGEDTDTDFENDQLRLQGTADTPFGPVEYFVIPLVVKNTIHGFTGYFSSENEPPYETNEVRLIETLAEEVGNAVANHELNQEIRKLVFNVVRTLVVTIEAKDQYTKGHSTRVFRLSELIGERLGMTERDTRHLRWAAILHDVGKIAIDNKILNKPGKLTNEEYDIIKTHPVEGAHMLDPISQLHHVIPGVRHHHERYDGDGYPDQLVGEQIPLFARIIAVADTFDAIASARPYRKDGNPERALKVIKDGAGTQFDPNISQTFLELEADGILVELLEELGLTAEDSLT